MNSLMNLITKEREPNCLRPFLDYEACEGCEDNMSETLSSLGILDSNTHLQWCRVNNTPVIDTELELRNLFTPDILNYLYPLASNPIQKVTKVVIDAKGVMLISVVRDNGDTTKLSPTAKDVISEFKASALTTLGVLVETSLFGTARITSSKDGTLTHKEFTGGSSELSICLIVLTHILKKETS